MSIRRLAIIEEEWRLLVDLVAGFDHRRYESAELRRAMAGLERAGLVQEVRNGFRVTELGRRVRADAPAFGHGAPRVWIGQHEVADSSSETVAKSQFCLPA